MELETVVNGWFFGNIALGGLIGSTTDATTGSIHRYSPSQYMVTLEPDGSAKIDAKPFLQDEQKVREYIVVAYRNLKEEFNKKQAGDYSKSLLTILKVPTPEHSAALEKIRALSLAYPDIPTFADRTAEMFLKGSGITASAQPSAAPVEQEVAKSDWKTITPKANIKIFSKDGEIVEGYLISADTEYIWINSAMGSKKAVLTSQIDKITIVSK
jgi:hypothetical protein